MAWGLTVHKAQCMTLQKETIDIENIDRQGPTFTAVSRVRQLTNLCIMSSFSFAHYARMKDSPSIQRRKQEETFIASRSIAPDVA